jgi:hypothetical protein
MDSLWQLSAYRVTAEWGAIPLNFEFAAAAEPRGSTPECVYNTPDFAGEDSWMFDHCSAR